VAEFLTSGVVRWTADGDPARRAELAVAEAARAVELAEAGILRRIWRVPGQWANWGLWEAPDATALHEALQSLPFFPWLEITVHPLAQHPNDPHPPEG
jgi:muconolactone D-isomerase